MELSPLPDRVSLPFQGRKATEAAGILLELAGGGMGRLRLIKLLYIAEREALRRWGRPICGGHYVSMTHGPVLSEVLDLVSQSAWHGSVATWNEHIAPGEHPNVVLIKRIEPAALSEAEVELLNEIHLQFRAMTDGDIWRYVHDPRNIPEYEDPNGTSTPINMPTMLTALGLSAAQIVDLISDMKALRARIDSFGE